MIVTRPAEMRDVDGIISLLENAGTGLTGLSSLRPYPELITTRVGKGVESFTGDLDIDDRVYFFITEDAESGMVIGTGAIYAAVGMHEAYYSYKVGIRVKASRELDVYTRVPTLYLTNDYTGCTEVGSLFVDLDYRRTNAGKLASLSRFLFIADHPEKFASKVFAEMRGYHREDGSAPFWEGVGQHFFKLSFPDADNLFARGNKQFIAELMPGHPIYVPLLDEEAQKAIGEVHPATVPARRLLEREGFRYEGYVDIFDGGPSLETRTTDLRATKSSVVTPVLIGSPEPSADPIVVANRSLAGFRSLITSDWSKKAHALVLTAEVADALQIEEGDEVRYMPVNPSEEAS